MAITMNKMKENFGFELIHSLDGPRNSGGSWRRNNQVLPCTVGYSSFTNFCLHREGYFTAANFDSLSRAQNWFFTLNSFEQDQIYVSNICEKFQGQNVYTKKVI